jgi:hypothetical protein
MKAIYFFEILSFYLILFSSCTQKSNKQEQSVITSPIQEVDKKISLNLVGTLEFVRSYSEIQSLHSKKEIDKYLEMQRKTNPSIIDKKIDEPLRKCFEELGIVQGNELLLYKFKPNNKLDFSFTDQFGKEIKIRFVRDIKIGLNDKIIASSGKDSCEIKARFFFGLKPAALDVIPGGNKELVVYSEHYLSNTEFYYFDVYEIIANQVGKS